MANQVSGKDGDLSLGGNALANIRRWTITYESDLHGHAHSDSEGWDEQTQGIQRWSGEVEIEANEGKVPAAVAAAIENGSLIAIDAIAYPGASYTGNIKLSGIPDFEVDITGGTVETFTFPFAGHGKLTLPTI
jgi:hypothetical protein